MESGSLGSEPGPYFFIKVNVSRIFIPKTIIPTTPEMFTTGAYQLGMYQLSYMNGSAIHKYTSSILHVSIDQIHKTWLSHPQMHSCEKCNIVLYAYVWQRNHDKPTLYDLGCLPTLLVY